MPNELINEQSIERFRNIYKQFKDKLNHESTTDEMKTYIRQLLKQAKEWANRRNINQTMFDQLIINLETIFNNLQSANGQAVGRPQLENRPTPRPLNNPVQENNTFKDFFNNATNLMKKMANGSHDLEQVAFELLESIVGFFIDLIVGIFKPFLGGDADEQVNDFTSAAKGLFHRIAHPVVPEATPVPAPQLETHRALTPQRSLMQSRPELTRPATLEVEPSVTSTPRLTSSPL